MAVAAFLAAVSFAALSASPDDDPPAITFFTFFPMGEQKFFSADECAEIAKVASESLPARFPAKLAKEQFRVVSPHPPLHIVVAGKTIQIAMICQTKPVQWIFFSPRKDQTDLIEYAMWLRAIAYKVEKQGAKK